MPIGKFVVENEAVQVNYQLSGDLTGPRTGTMELMQTPTLKISAVLLNVLGGTLVTDNGQAYQIEFINTENGLSGNFHVLPPHSR